MESWGAHGVFAARYADEWSRVGAATRRHRIRGPLLLAACIVVGALLGSLALGSYATGDGASLPGDGTPASVFTVGPAEPARIPALDEGLAPRSGGADRPRDQQGSGEPSDDELMVDVRRVMERLASES